MDCIKSESLIREKVIRKIISPGKKLTHQATSKTSFPSAKIEPQLTCGGIIPIPKKESPLSASIAPLTPKVKLMKKIGANKGVKYLIMILKEFTFEILSI